MLEERAAADAQAQAAPPPPQPGQYQYQRAPEPPKPRGRAPKEEPGMFEKVLKSPMARSVATTVTRGLMGALLGTPRRRRRGSLW